MIPVRPLQKQANRQSTADSLVVCTAACERCWSEDSGSRIVAQACAWETDLLQQLNSPAADTAGVLGSDHFAAGTTAIN